MSRCEARGALRGMQQPENHGETPRRQATDQGRSRRLARFDRPGWLGDALKVRVTAPPERGRANAAVEGLVADALGLPRRDARVVAGMTSTRKLLEIEGISEAELHRRLSNATGERRPETETSR